MPPGLDKVKKDNKPAPPKIHVLSIPEPPTNIVGLATITNGADAYVIEFRNWTGPYWISSTDGGMGNWHKVAQGDAGTNGQTVIRVLDKENVQARFYRLHF